MVAGLVAKFVVKKLAKSLLGGGGGSKGPGIAGIEVEGARALQTNIAKSAAKLDGEIGKVHKEVGKFVIRRLKPRPSPEAVGTGRGAAVRPSATKREVLLRVGGAHRAGKAPAMQWGKRTGRSIRSPAPPRPYILRTAREHEKDVLKFYAKAVKAASKGTFDKIEGL